MARGLRPLLSVLLIGGSGLGLYNVYSDNGEVVRLGETVACGSPGCALKKVKESRSPFGQTFVFQTRLQPPETIGVECRRDWVLLGSYHCE